MARWDHGERDVASAGSIESKLVVAIMNVSYPIQSPSTRTQTMTRVLWLKRVYESLTLGYVVYANAAKLEPTAEARVLSRTKKA